MLVKDLINKLQQLPDNLTVMMQIEDYDFTVTEVQEVKVERIRFHEEGSEVGKEPECYEDCVIIKYDI